MSRIGKMPIAIPAGVTVDVAENNKVTVKGPKGTLSRVLAPELSIKVENGEIVVERPNDLKRIKSLHGLTRTLINNMVVGSRPMRSSAVQPRNMPFMYSTLETFQPVTSSSTA